MTGTLVSGNYKASSGYELTKRPGLDTFLRQLSKIGEVVVLANEDIMVYGYNNY